MVLGSVLEFVCYEKFLRSSLPKNHTDTKQNVREMESSQRSCKCIFN